MGPARYFLRKTSIFPLLLILVVYCTSMIFPNRENRKTCYPVTEDSSYFAGSAACQKCHPDIYKDHLQTAHYLDSKPGQEDFIRGSFEKDRNRFTYNKFMEVVMEKEDSGLFQTAYISGQVYQKEKIGMVIGSGRKGQTYFFWKEGRLYQLPVSYYRPSDSWCNSPGYTTNIIRYDRDIHGYCIECHGTYASTTENADGTTVFNPSSIIYGVDCERCHGPALAHIRFHEMKPGEKKGQFIINPSRMTRQQRLDLCALCHSGLRNPIQPAFSFIAGNRLDSFSTPNYSEDSVALLDVHGNQYGLLSSSKCFRSSEMDCSSCHNVHRNEYANTQIFSQRCMNCHNQTNHDTCRVKGLSLLQLQQNCIDCHMPALPSKKIFLQTTDPLKSSADFVRTHRVAVYAAESAKMIKRLKSNQ